MPTAPQFEWPQGEPLFETQWRAVTESLAGNGVLDAGDLALTPGTANREVAYAAGTVYYVATQYNETSGSVTVSAGDANEDRWDTIAYDTATIGVEVKEGTPAANPEPPDVDGDEILLGVVYVPQNFDDVLASSQILNWRGRVSNEAAEVIYTDGTGVYGVNNVDAALDELQEAAQITAYPLALGTDTDMDAAGTDLTDSSAGVTVWDTSAGVVPQAQLGGPASSLSAYPLAPATDLNVNAYPFALGDLASPFSLPSITDMDAAGNDLVDGSTTIWDTTAGWVPREQVDDEKTTTGPHTSNVTTSGEEVVSVDTSGGAVTVTLASADANLGNFVTVIDVGGAAGINSITVDTEGSETIDGQSSKTVSSDFSAIIVYSNGTNWFTSSGSGTGGGVSIEDNGATVLDPASGIGFGTDLSATDNGDGTVTVDSDAAGVNVLATGTFTHTGGSATSTTVAAVTTDQTANLYVEVGVDSDPSFSANYAWDYTWGEAWDDTNSEKDVTIDATWDTDPGSGNDVVLDYRIYTLDVSVSKSRKQDLVDSPNGNVPTALLEDTESIEISVPVPDGESLKVYRWGAYLISDGSAPTGLQVQLLDGGDTVQASENTSNTESTGTPVASHGNASGSLSIFKLRIDNATGNSYTTDGVGGLFAYVVE